MTAWGCWTSCGLDKEGVGQGRGWTRRGLDKERG